MKQLVVLNVVKGFFIFLEGHTFFMAIFQLAHTTYVFSSETSFSMKALSSPDPCCSLDSNRTFSHPYSVEVELILVNLLASRISLKCQIFLHLIKDEIGTYSFYGGKKM